MVSETPPITGRVFPGSWLDHLLHDVPILDQAGAPLNPYLPHAEHPRCLVAALDHGNGAFKGVVRDANQPQLHTRRVVSAYVPVPPSVSGSEEMPRTFRVDEGEAFRIGDEAIRQKGRAGDTLPIGQTAERLADARQTRFVLAFLVDMLIEAGYPEGYYPILLGFGIPNDEFDREGGQMTVTRETRVVLSRLREEGTYRVVADEGTRTTNWTLKIVSLAPLPQSIGSFFAWGRGINGRVLTGDMTGVRVLDIGGGHLQDLDIALNARGGHHAYGGILGDGTVVIAEQLRLMMRQSQRFPRARFSVAELQQALFTHQVQHGGSFVEIGDLVEDAIQSQGQTIIGLTLPALQDTRMFLLWTGGGAALLHEQIRERSRVVGRSEQDYLVVPAPLAPVLNAVGIYVHTLLTFRRGRANGSSERG